MYNVSGNRLMQIPVTSVSRNGTDLYSVKILSDRIAQDTLSYVSMSEKKGFSIRLFCDKLYVIKYKD